MIGQTQTADGEAAGTAGGGWKPASNSLDSQNPETLSDLCTRQEMKDLMSDLITSTHPLTDDTQPFLATVMTQKYFFLASAYEKVGSSYIRGLDFRTPSSTTTGHTEPTV